jgi:1-acyl-sn-glycerol-3-phosphate acyltransferase
MSTDQLPTFTRPHHDWRIDRLQRWKRRLLTVPAVLIAALVVWGLSPLLLVLALVADLAEGFRRRRWLRVLGFVMVYLFVEILAIFTAVALWVITCFGLMMHHDWAQRIHRFIQVLWARSMLLFVTVFMSTRVRTEGNELVLPGPVIGMARHVSMGDAVVPVTVLGWDNKLALRYVLKNDLVWVPTLDIYGHRLPNYFVDRNPANRDTELGPIRRLAEGIDEGSAGGIFPEGTFRTPTRFERAIARIERSDPERALRVGRLRHLLPPRYGGTLAMLAGAPEADAVIIGHVGFEKFHTFKEMLAHLPFDHDVEVKVWRVPRRDIPTDEDAQVVWLDDQWLVMDDWIDDRIASRGLSSPAAPSSSASPGATMDEP